MGSATLTPRLNASIGSPTGVASACRSRHRGELPLVAPSFRTGHVAFGAIASIPGGGVVAVSGSAFDVSGVLS